MKQETLEQVAEKEYPDGCDGTNTSAEIYRRIFIDGAEWQAKRMYSEEEVLNILGKYNNHIQENFDPSKTILPIREWFEQFKKK